MARRFRVGVSGTSATVTAEGPLGSSARGSWLVGVRRSNVEWPVGRDDHHMTVFGFGMCNPSSSTTCGRQQVCLSLVAGVSNVEREDEVSSRWGWAQSRGDGGLAWRSVVGSRTVVTQRVSALAHEFLNRDQAMRPVNRGANGAGAYRVDITQTLFRGVVEAGARSGGCTVRDAGRMRDRRSRPRRSMTSTRHGSSDPAWLLSAGGRGASRSRRDFAWPIRRWCISRRSIDGFRPNGRLARWLVHGSTGVMHQFPALEQSGMGEPADLRPERATYADLGIGQRLSASLRWDATVFARRERDALRAPDSTPD